MSSVAPGFAFNKEKLSTQFVRRFPILECPHFKHFGQEQSKQRRFWLFLSGTAPGILAALSLPNEVTSLPQDRVRHQTQEHKKARDAPSFRKGCVGSSFPTASQRNDVLCLFMTAHYTQAKGGQQKMNILLAPIQWAWPEVKRNVLWHSSL